MRRLLALILVAAAVGGAAFFADHPGHVEIVWQGWQVDTSVGVLVGAVALVVLIGSLLVLVGAALHRMPRAIRRRRAARRRRVGEAALTQGIVALAAGQAAEAERAAQRATRLLDGAPMALLLHAEAATRQGDMAAARGAYTVLLGRPDTEFLGLRGLIGQALRAGDDDAALRLAERARKLRPDASWLIDALLVLAARAGDWTAAQGTLAGAARHRVLPAERARHHRGIVLYELSRDAERRGDLRRAAGLAATAQVLAADLAAPAYHHARLLIGLGKKRAAARTIERAWHTAPHPDLARLYLEVDPDAPPLVRVAAAQRLAAHNPEAMESRLAIAEAALVAQLWGEARRHLALAITAAPPSGSSSAGSPSPRPSRRLCLLMARLEEKESGDMAAARDWLDRAIGAPPDPSYLCHQCGGETPEWQALCRDCGGFDTLVWQNPPFGDRAVTLNLASAGTPLMLPAPQAPGADGGRPPLLRPPASGLALPLRPPASGLAPPPRWDK
jgi:HemY protein